MKLLFLISLIALSACVQSQKSTDTDRNSNLTQGSVQMNVVEGVTNKTQILEVFGAPNITTRDASGIEVWTYQRAGQATQSTSESAGWSIIFAGQNYSNSGFSSNSRMMTLIIKFNAKDIVSDFSSRTSNF